MAFTSEQNHYINNIESRGARVIVGGQLDRFVPNINSSKWDDEFWFNINFPQVVTNQIASLTDGVISQTIDDFTHRFFMQPDDSLEYEVVIAKRPPRSYITLDIDFSPGLTFHYQNPLTPEQIAAGFSQPENITGSYAVYCNKANNQYQTGKFCHIYRPWARDANADQVWGTLNIDPVAKTLTISFDSQWVRDAAYPITIGPNLGYQTAGEQSYGSAAHRITCSYAGDPGEAGTLTAIHASVSGFDSTDDEGVGCVYVSSAGVPTTLVDYGTAYYNAGNTSQQWLTFPGLDAAISSGTAYYAGLMQEFSNVVLYYDEVNGPAHIRFVDASWPVPWNPYGTPDTTWATGVRFSIYIEYASGSSSSSSSSSLSSSSSSSSLSSSSSSSSLSSSSSSSSQAAATLIQEGFCFRNDDGSETTATWNADQDANITLGANTAKRLRFVIDTTGDPASKNLQLEYRYKPSGGAFGSWTKVT